MCSLNAHSPTLHTRPDHLSSSSWQLPEMAGKFKKRSVSILDQVISFFCWIGRGIRNFFTAIYSRLISQKSSVDPKVNRYTPVTPDPQQQAEPVATKGNATTFKPATNHALDNKSISPGVPRAVFIIGGCGAGKSTLADQLIQSNNHKQKRNYQLIDADKVKEEMPRYQNLVKAGDPDAALKVHTESITIKDQLVKDSRENKLNIVYTGTGRDTVFYINEINKFKRAGYYVKVFFVDANESTCLDRAHQRQIQTGRKVPDRSIKSSNQRARINFNTKLRQAAHTARHYDNNEGMVLKSKSKNNWEGLETRQQNL